MIEQRWESVLVENVLSTTIVEKEHTATQTCIGLEWLAAWLHHEETKRSDWINVPVVDEDD